MDIDTKKSHALFLYNDKMADIVTENETAFSSKSVLVKKKVAKRVGVSKRTVGRWVLEYLCEEEAEFDVPVPGIPGIGNFSYFWWYRNRYQKKLVPEKSLGTGIGKIWYRKKVSEPVSEKFSTGKKSQNRYRKNLVPEILMIFPVLNRNKH